MPFDFDGIFQAIGVVVVYAFIKEILPRLFKTNGNGKMTITQHDKECEYKLSPIREDLRIIREDLRLLMRTYGITPKEH